MPSRALLLSAFAFIGVGPAVADTLPDFAPYLMADRSAEVALARTAAPKEVSDTARVLVLTRTGFVEAERGTGRFTCVVLRSFSGAPSDPNFWNPRVRAPHCFNPAGARTVLPETLKRAEWILAGVGTKEVEARARRAREVGEFPKTAPGAMAYMLSPQQHLQDDQPHWMPHLMLYLDRSIEAADWGAGGMTAPIIDASVGDPDGPVRTLLVPVSQWSDGTPFRHGANH